MPGKMIDKGIEVNGVMLRKSNDAHKAAVVGDPFKDTSGSSLNILLKLMSIVRAGAHFDDLTSNDTGTTWPKITLCRCAPANPA